MRALKSQPHSTENARDERDDIVGRSRPARDTDHVLERHAGTIAEFQSRRGSLERFTELTSSEEYGLLMSELRRSALILKANPNAGDARARLEAAAKALDVPVIDLEALARVPPDSVAAGLWRPRSVNVDLVDPDPTTRLGPETPFQKTLNTLSSKLLPEVKKVEVPGLQGLYSLARLVIPAVDAGGKAVSRPVEIAGDIIRGWSDALASDVVLRLRAIRDATRASGLDLGDIASLPEIQQRMFLFTAARLSDMALDVEEFVKWARSPDTESVPASLGARLRSWSSSGLFGLSKFLRAVAAGVHDLTNEEAWRASTIHIQIGGGLEKFTVTTRGGITIMFPTLEQAERDGATTIRLVSRLNPVETMFGGMTLTSRGGGLKFRAGPIGAKVSEFEHEVKAGIPGIIGVSVGEDYAYGPSVAFGYSPPIALLTVLPLPLNVRVGGEVTLFHPALARTSRATRRMAEGISVACDAVGDKVQDIGRSIGWVKTAAKTSEDGWPLSQRWQLARRTHDRAESARTTARDRLSRIQALDPARWLECVGTERARTFLGDDTARPRHAHRLITDYLESSIATIEAESAAMREFAQRAIETKAYNKAALQRLNTLLERQTLAFEFVDVLLVSLLGTEHIEQSPVESDRLLRDREMRPPHADRGQGRSALDPARKTHIR